MAVVYRHGLTRVSDSDGEKLVGSYSTPFFLKQTRLFVTSTSEKDSVEGDGASQLVVTGFDAENKRKTEFLTLKGINSSFTTNEYKYLDRIYVKGDKVNYGVIHIHNADGSHIGSIQEKSLSTNNPFYHVTQENTKLLGFGACVEIDSKDEPVTLSLYVLKNKRRLLVHRAFVNSGSTNKYSHSFNDYVLGVDDTVALYVSTKGTNINVSGWVEVLE